MIVITQEFWLVIDTLFIQTIIFIIGYTILYFLPNNKDFPPFQKFAISYGIGTGFICLSMFICIIIGFHSRISFFPLLIIIISLFLYFKIWKILKEDIKKILILIKHPKFNTLEWFSIFLLIVELIYLFLYWFIYPIYIWDAIAIWDARAKYIFYDGNFEYINYIKTHPSYPILVPLNLTFFYSIFFQYHYFAKILFVSYFIFLILFLYYSLRFFKLNRTYSLLISTFLALIGVIFFHATIAYADLTLTFFYTISTIFLFYYLSTEKKNYLVLSSLFMGFMAWTKVEGIGLLILNNLILLIFHIFLLSKKRINYRVFLKRTLLFFIIGFIIYIPWLLFSIFNGFTLEYISHILIIFDIPSTISDIIIILRTLIFEIFYPRRWGIIFWVVLFIILLLNMRSIFNEKIFFLVLLVISHFLLYIVIYIISTRPLQWQLDTSLHRELLHLAPICCFLIGILISHNEGKLVEFKEDSFYKIIVYFFITIIILFIIILTFFS